MTALSGMSLLLLYMDTNETKIGLETARKYGDRVSIVLAVLAFAHNITYTNQSRHP